MCSLNTERCAPESAHRVAAKPEMKSDSFSFSTALDISVKSISGLYSAFQSSQFTLLSLAISESMNVHYTKQVSLNSLVALFLIAILVITVLYTYTQLLDPQAQNEYSKSKWTVKQANKQKATDKTQSNTAAKQKQKAIAKAKRASNSAKSILDSQAGMTKHPRPSIFTTSTKSSNLSFSEYYTNHIMPYFSGKKIDTKPDAWASFRVFSTKSLDLSALFLSFWNSCKALFAEYAIDFSSLNFENCVHVLHLITKCELYTRFTRVLNMLVTLGWIKTFDWKIFDVTFFKSKTLNHDVTVFELLSECAAALKLILASLTSFPTLGFAAFYNDAHKVKYQDRYTMLLSKKVLVDVGRGLDMDTHEYDRILYEMITQTLELIGTSESFEKTMYTRNLKELRSIQASRTLAQRDFIREKPYGILLYGGSAVGKSAMSSGFIRYVLEANGFDSSPRSVIVLNEFDKFQSEYRSFHSGVIFDDLCNANPETSNENPLMKVIQFINNTPQAALNANVEMKGNVMIEPKIVLATTNVKHLNAKHYSEEPLAIQRRFQITITQRVKKEFCQPGTEMIDSKAIREAFGSDPYPDFAEFDVQTAVTKPGAISTKSTTFVPIVYKGQPMMNVGIKQLILFLRDDSRAHFSEQKQFVQAQRDNEVLSLCEHGLPPGCCEHCPLESQYFEAITDVADKYLIVEERLCTLLEYYLRVLANSRYGGLILAFLSRRYLRHNAAEFIKTALVVFLISCFIELYLQEPQLIRFVSYILINLLIAGSKVWLERRRLVKKLTTVPRPSKWFMSLSYWKRMQIISACGGMATITIIVKIVRKITALPTAHAAAPIQLKPNTVGPPEHPKWGSEGAALREKDYRYNPSLEHEATTMTTDELFNSMKRRQYMLHIGEEGSSIFCNTVPIMGNVLLIPGHVVPKKATKARITKANANPKNVMIQPESCYLIPKTDFALWYCPEMGNQRNIIKHFPEYISKGKRVSCFLMYNDCGTVKRFDNMRGTRATTLTTKGGWFDSMTYSFPGETFNGLCIATLIATDLKGNPFIGGFHLAGKGSFGAAGFLTKDQILSAVANLNKKPSVLVSHSSEPFDTTVVGVAVGPLTAPDRRCVSNNLPGDAKCVVFGQHTLSRSTPVSGVVTSMISSSVATILGLPKLHGAPHDMRDVLHKEVDIAAKTDAAFSFHGDSIDKAYVDLSTQILSGLTKEELGTIGILNNDAVVAGYDGVQGVNSIAIGTSAGFPFKGTKKQFITDSDRFVDGISSVRDVDPLIWEEVTRMEVLLRQGKCINTVFKGALKDEPTKHTKKKVRVIAGSNTGFTLLVRKYFLTLSAIMQEKKGLFECAVGINVYSPEWTDLMQEVYKYGIDRVVAGDYKAFDGRMSPRFMLAAFKILIAIAEESGNYEEDDLMVMRGIATEITNPTYDYFGTLIQFFGSNPSGHPLTVVINSLVNSLYMRYCYFEIAKAEKWWKVPPYCKVVSLLTYGDDNIMSVKEGFEAYNHTRIAEVFALSGITYTMADKEAASVPFIHGSEAGFLKHDAIWDDELNLYRAVIDEDSIAKTLHAHIRSRVLSEEEHSACAITDVADKYFHFGREKYTTRMAQLTEVARECKLLGIVGELPTYDEQLTRYREKYEWQEELLK